MEAARLQIMIKDESVLRNLSRADEMHLCLANELAGSYDTKGDRGFLFVAFVSVLMSHHEAILTLSKHERLAGSAFALFRPLVETSFRGLFTGFLATDDEVETIKVGGEPYGQWNELAARLDKTFDYDGVFTQYGGKAWKALCGYTHTGLEQLSSRIQPDGKVQARYEVDEINDLINSSTSASVLAIIPFLEAIGNAGDSNAVSNFYKKLYPVPYSLSASVDSSFRQTPTK
jgi:hypothetical protein